MTGIQPFLDRVKQRYLFFTIGMIKYRWVLLGLSTQIQQQGGITTVIQNHVGEIFITVTIAPIKNTVCKLPVLIEVFALESKYRCTTVCNRCSCVVLRGIDIARSPTDLGTQGLE